MMSRNGVDTEHGALAAPLMPQERMRLALGMEGRIMDSSQMS